MPSQDFLEIGKWYLKEYGITYCPRSECKCWSRPHAHPDTKKICKIPMPTGRKSLFDFLHEVGHIAHPRGGIKRELRAIEEYYATLWAKKEMRTLGIAVAKDQEMAYFRYVKMSLDRARRRGLKVIPPELRIYR